MSGRRLMDGPNFQTLVKSQRSIPMSPTRFHGITDDMVTDAPDIKVALKISKTISVIRFLPLQARHSNCGLSNMWNNCPALHSLGR